MTRKHSPHREILSHTEAAHILSDPHGFRVNREKTPQNSMTEAFVGKDSRGKVVYMEFVIGAGDHYAVTFLRAANVEELSFYEAAE